MPKNREAETLDWVAGEYLFGTFRMSPDGSLLKDDVACAISKKEFSLLRVLVSNAGAVVRSEELQRAGWGATHVTTDSLPRAISSLRSRIGVPGAIRSFYGKGYCFMMPVERVFPVEVASLPELPKLPRLSVTPLTGAAGVPSGIGVGIAESALLRLGRSGAPGAMIMSRESVFSLCEKGVSAVEAGRRLGADLVLCGFVRPLGAKYRLRLEMVRVADEVELWCEEFLLARDELRGAGTEVADCLMARLIPHQAETHREKPRMGVIERLAAEESPRGRQVLRRGFTSYEIV